MTPPTSEDPTQPPPHSVGQLPRPPPRFDVPVLLLGQWCWWRRSGEPARARSGVAPPENGPVQLDLEGEPLELVKQRGVVIPK